MKNKLNWEAYLDLIHEGYNTTDACKKLYISRSSVHPCNLSEEQIKELAEVKKNR